MVDGNRPAAPPSTLPIAPRPESPASTAQPQPASPAITPSPKPAPTNDQLGYASLICGYTAKDAPRQMDDFGLARHFGLSPNIIAARPDDFYRRWVIQTVRQVLPSSPEDCQAILDNPRGASAITLKLLAGQKPDAPATAGQQTNSGDSPDAAGIQAANKPPDAPGTAQRIMDVGDKIRELGLRPKGEVTQQELDEVLGRLHDLHKAPDLTDTEHHNLVGLGLTAFTIAASHGLKTPQETVNDPLFADAAVGSMAFSGGGNSSLKAPGSQKGNLLPKTNSTHVPETIGPPVVDGALPNAERAYINMEKLSGYALDTTNSDGANKARVFQSALGYNQSNADELWRKIQRGVTQNKAVPGVRDKYGRRYTVDMPITGPNGNTAQVRTAWIFDPGKTTARLTTAYVKK